MVSPAVTTVTGVFTSFDPAPQASREQVMAMLIAVAAELSMPDRPGACIIAGITVAQEAGSDPHGTGLTQFWCPANPTNDAETMAFPHDSTSDDSASSGYYQQQPPWWGTAAQRMSLHDSTVLFMTSLKRYPYSASGPDVADQWAQKVQGSAYPLAYAPHYNDITALYAAVSAGTPTPPEEPPVTSPLAAARPNFNEYHLWVSKNFESRQNTPVDLWLIHTEESSGYDNADGLAHWLETTTDGSNPVSYHYTISKGQNDDGVTVCDVVDTDQACWAVGNSNLRSINLCFAGSTIDWTTAEWDNDLGRCIDVAAYLFVQDSIKYSIGDNVIPGPNYNSNPPGLSDHRYCTDYLKDGNTHTDVGDNFPWPMLQTAVAKYWAIANSPAAPIVTPPAPPVPAAPVPVGPADDQIDLRWKMLGDQTELEALAQIRDVICGTNDRQKIGPTGT